jgi:hypothetical protein
MYRCVVVRLTCPASSWIAFAVAPRMASREQKVCRRMCSRPVIGSLALRSAHRTLRDLLGDSVEVRVFAEKLGARVHHLWT